MRFFIHLSYDGSRYHGWQRQPNGISVQSTLEDALSTLLRNEIKVVGAGRTDAGVHAKVMVAHFDYDTSLDCKQLVYKLNKLLPQDVAVDEVNQVDDEMHARFSAKSRTYKYFIHFKKSVFINNYSWQMYGELDFDKMNQAANLLLDYDDFTSFSKVNTDTKTNICDITYAQWIKIDSNRWYFEISANRFLRNMVRAIVGTLIDIGRGKLTLDDFRRIIESKNRCCAGESVPGKALFLTDITY